MPCYYPHPPTLSPHHPHALPPRRPPPAFVLITTTPEQMVLCFALAGGDRQLLSANSLLGNQLTTVWTAPGVFCLFFPSCNHYSSTLAEKGAAAVRRNIIRVTKRSGRSRLGDLSLQTASCVSPRRSGVHLEEGAVRLERCRTGMPTR
ncbi:hypothetical protein AMECASPLE_009329 [Ameca splendens]|uniref:Uncharacterized protein n=1 Tax=Ameca splendens TaxID=208324 RepID=A0ABV1A6G5_9TELE